MQGRKRHSEARLWKQYNILKTQSTEEMTENELRQHEKAIKKIEKDLHLDDQEV